MTDIECIDVKFTENAPFYDIEKLRSNFPSEFYIEESIVEFYELYTKYIKELRSLSEHLIESELFREQYAIMGTDHIHEDLKEYTHLIPHELLNLIYTIRYKVTNFYENLMKIWEFPNFEKAPISSSDILSIISYYMNKHSERFKKCNTFIHKCFGHYPQRILLNSIVIEYMTKFIGNDSCIEFGSGTGYISHCLRHAGIDIVATDPALADESIHTFVQEDSFVTPENLTGVQAVKKYPHHNVLINCYPPPDVEWVDETVNAFKGDKFIFLTLYGSAQILSENVLTNWCCVKQIGLYCISPQTSYADIGVGHIIYPVIYFFVRRSKPTLVNFLSQILNQKGGNNYYQKKYLKYKSKYLLLKHDN
jgi:hypothetical protein